jgi:predicted ATPase
VRVFAVTTRYLAEESSTVAALEIEDSRSNPSGPEPDSVRVHLARLLRSDAFANAPSLRRLLSYVVDRSLEGQGDAVKEYAIGVDVFDRGEAFDPQTDTIVRVQARRLRSKLEEYYQGEGACDAVLIAIPKGGYLPRFLAVPASERRDVADAMAGWCWRRRSDDTAIGAARSRPISTVPAPRTPLIGRELELARVRGLLLGEGVGLVTLTGPGGSGKTRLALQVASEAVEEYPGGVLFVGLASVSDFRDVAPTVAQALGLRRIDSGPIEETLRAHVRQRIGGRTLLVLDTFEHLLPAAPLLAVLAESSALLRILVTSRSVLRVSGEHCFQVPPLDVPDLSAPLSVQALAANAAVALFVQRAAAGQESFALNAENAPVIAEICARVDGLPLAIELAAAHIRILSPLQLRERLESRLGVLTGGGCDLPARQQTLRRTIDWSHELLGRTEKRLFRRLAVFAGSWTLAGAEAVCNARRDLEVGVLEGMSSLVDKSLIRQVADDHSELRFAMLETVREYALEHLDASAERLAVERAHAAYCIVLAEEGLAPPGPAEPAAWLARCDREHDNHRAALDHLIGADDCGCALRLAQALFPFWDRRGDSVPDARLGDSGVRGASQR